MTEVMHYLHHFRTHLPDLQHSAVCWTHSSLEWVESKVVQDLNDYFSISDKGLCKVKFRLLQEIQVPQ